MHFPSILDYSTEGPATNRSRENNDDYSMFDPATNTSLMQDSRNVDVSTISGTMTQRTNNKDNTPA